MKPHGPLTIHSSDDKKTLFPRGKILSQLRSCSMKRGLLLFFIVFLAAALLFGKLEPESWGYFMASVLSAFIIAFFIIATVSDHFLEEHLWQHVTGKHVPRIFFWTLGSLLLMYYINDYIDFDSSFLSAPWLLLLAACIIGIIPESGPHLIFVTLYARGSIPFSILLASSIVQDGHGMLPMLAHSRKMFLVVKGINFVIGLVVGAIALSCGL